MKSDHRAKFSATIEIQRCGLQQVRMIASANVQAHFCLLLTLWIAEGALQGGSDMHVVSIVAFEVEERTAQDSLAINTKYQCRLLVEMGNNTVKVYQNRCDVEGVQDCRRPPGVCPGSRPSVYSGGNVILFVDAAAHMDSEHWTRRLAQEPFRQAP